MASSDALGQQKCCAVCGRTFGWRKRWARSWPSIRVCSPACRKRRLTKTDRALEQAILSLLQETQRGGSLTPNDAAQAVGDDWRPLAERARDAARRLAARGLVEFFQSGRRVDPSSAKGPVQLRRPPDAPQRGTST